MRACASGTRLVNDLLNLLPVTPSLDELVYAIANSFNAGLAPKRDNLLFWSKRCPVSSDIFHDLREIFGVGDDIDVANHLQVGKVLGNPRLLE